ncbi:hypothetical protein DV736_g5746, partial [Chaetothyriales sp. CBS 134916]
MASAETTTAGDSSFDMFISLNHRLRSLQAAHKATLALIEQLQSFDPLLPDSDRLDLSSQIHDSLKEQEDTLALLRQELDGDDIINTSASHRRLLDNSAPSEREHNADLEARLAEDLKTARGRFRRAQLQAKKRADDAKRKEREALFRRKDPAVDDGSHPRRPGSRRGTQAPPAQERLTADELARNASDDVTRALTRAHDLLSANLAQSQFAQQTLDESQSALKALSESYGGTTDLLKASRGLVGQLVRSNKSDTWYLQTAFYLIAITIAWLVFRRWLYGPLWWLVFLPLKLGWKGTALLIGSGGVGGRGGAIVTMASAATTTRGPTTRTGFPLNPSGVVFKSIPLPAKGGGWGGPAHPPNQPPPSVSQETMVDKVGKMVDESQTATFDIDNLSDEERRRQEEQARNPLKRMMEVDTDRNRKKDEL